MSAECFCDYDGPEFYDQRTITARKEHRCYECGHAIRAGETYERVAGKWDGRFDVFKTCKRCVDLRAYTQAHVPCLCWDHGSLLDDCYNTVEWYAYQAPGLMFGLLRRMVAINRSPAIEAKP